MRIREILRAKGSTVHTISAMATLQDVVHRLVKFNCGSLVVQQPDGTERGQMIGIITERDILRACASHPSALDTLRVTERMSKDPITGTPDDTVEQAMGIMTEHRIRHLPIVEQGELVGMISIGDVVKSQHDHLSMENHYLKSYLHG